MAVTSTLPRVRLAQLPTPVVAAPRLGAALGLAGNLLVKRDDLTGFAVAGNKARPLEMLLADAERAGADTLVTGGAPSSNFCAAAVAAARRGDLDCLLVYAGDEGRHPNLSAARDWGATLRWTGSAERSSVDDHLEVVADELRGAGRVPYVVPRGGATPLGATGFHTAAAELATQLSTSVHEQVSIVIAAGSGGSSAGLLAGAAALGFPWTICAASVSRPVEETSARVLELATGCAALLGTPSPDPATLTVVDARGPGHGLESEPGLRAADLALASEGLVLDPVYSAKALAALPELLGPRREDPSTTTVFWHTGGLLDAVARWVR